MSPSAKLGAKDVVQRPNAKATQENTQSTGNHDPHGLEDLSVSRSLSLQLDLLLMRQCTTLARLVEFCLSLSKARSDVDFHDIHCAEQDHRCQQGVRVLVKGRVLEIMVIASDKERKGNKRDGQDERDGVSCLVRKGSVAHQACGVDHGELVDKLPWI